MIEVTFGKLVSGGKVARSDTIVYPHPGKMNTRWWINNRRSIEPEDLDEVLSAKPEYVVIGSGYMQHISISDAGKECLKREGVKDIFVHKTEEAAKVFNEYYENKNKVIGLFHLI